jgi:hypothetical protein
MAALFLFVITNTQLGFQRFEKVGSILVITVDFFVITYGS